MSSAADSADDVLRNALASCGSSVLEIGRGTSLASLTSVQDLSLKRWTSETKSSPARSLCSRFGDDEGQMESRLSEVPRLL